MQIVGMVRVVWIQEVEFRVVRLSLFDFTLEARTDACHETRRLIDNI